MNRIIARVIFPNKFSNGLCVMIFQFGEIILAHPSRKLKGWVYSIALVR